MSRIPSRCRSVWLVAGLAAALASPATAQTPKTLLQSPSTHLFAYGPIRVADVDGDGLPDLVFFIGNDWIGVSRGDGVGGLGPVVFSVIHPTIAMRIAAGDLDEDGRADVAITVKDSSVLRTYLGQPDATVIPDETLALAEPGDGFLIDLLDLTEDGHLDLVASIFEIERLTLYPGLGDGSFGAVTEIASGIEAGELDWGDIDGDGHLDLVQSAPIFQATAPVVFKRGHGDGTFDPPITVTPPDIGTQGTAVGDFDGDGRADIATSPGFGNALRVWSWLPGHASFGPPTVIASDGIVPGTLLAAGDWNRDGLDDLATAWGEGRVDTWLGDADALLVADDQFATGRGPIALATADVDQDGGMDLVFTTDTIDGATIESGRGDGEFRPYEWLGAPGVDMDVADVTGDGLPDVVAVRQADVSAVLLPGRYGGGLGEPEAFDAGVQPARVWLLDATGDGPLDAVTVGPTTVSVAASHGDGSFEPPVVTDLGLPIADAAYGSLGGSALPDVAALVLGPSPTSPGRIHLLINQGGGAFTAAGVVSTIGAPGANSLAVADVDGDSATDLLVRTDTALHVYLAQAGGGYAAGSVTELDGGEPGLLMGDVDGDLDVDVVARLLFNGVRVLLNDGTGAFPAFVDYGDPNLVYPHSLSLDDLDGDGVSDLVIGLETPTYEPFEWAIVVAAGFGDGTFAENVHWSVGSDVLATRAADMNGDGAPDLVVLLEGGGVLVMDNGQGPWSKLGHSLAGAVGYSRLEAIGPLLPGSVVTLRVRNGAPGAASFLVVGLTQALAPFKGGVLVPAPDAVVTLGHLDTAGSLDVSADWPAVPSGTQLVFQVWRPEAAAPHGFAATTAIAASVP